MQANSQTIVCLKNGLLTVHSSESDVAAVHYLLALGQKNLMENGYLDGTIELPAEAEPAAVSQSEAAPV